MPVFPQSFIQEVRSRTSIVSLVAESVKLKRRGNEFWGCCPFHHEKTASFSVSDEKEYYHCFGCGAHGSVFDFAQKILGMTFPESVEYLARRAGMEIPQATPQEYERERKKTGLSEALEAACKFYEEQLEKPAGREGLFYLQRRGLTPETVKRFRLGFAPSGNALKAHLTREGFDTSVLIEAGLAMKSERDGSLYDYFRNRVMFPIADRRGKIIAFGGRVMDDGEPKYLNSPDTPVFSKGDNLYALHLSAQQARKMQEIIVVEGYMDVIAMAQAGIERAVAPLGTALTERQIELLWRYTPEPLCCFDGDGAGQRAAARAADRVLPLLTAGRSLRFITLPDDLDPDEYIKEHGKASLEEFLKTQYRPLFKQLWGMLLANRPLDTPERKAGLSKDIEECLEKIKDPTVQGFYRQDFKSALWEITSPYKNKAKNAAPTGFDRKRGAVKTAAPVNHPALTPERDDTRMLLAYLLLYPDVAADFLEDLADWQAPLTGQDEALAAVLDALAADPDVTADRLREHLSVTGRAGVYDRLATEIEMLKRKSPLPQDARENIAALLSGMRRKNLRAELMRLAEKIADADGEEAEKLWQRYQNLLKEEKGLA